MDGVNCLDIRHGAGGGSGGGNGSDSGGGGSRMFIMPTYLSKSTGRVPSAREAAAMLLT